MLTWGMWVLIIGSFAVFGEVLYIFAQRPSYYKSMLSMCFCALLLWMCGYLVELQSITAGNIDAALAGTRMSYLGKPFVPLTIFLFLMRCSNISVPKWVTGALTALHTAIAITAFTSNFHNWFYTSVAIDEAGQNLVLGHGWAYYVYMVTVFLYAIANVILTVWNYKHAANSQEHRRALLLSGIVLFGVFGYLLFLLGVTDGFDITLIGTMLSAMVLFVLFIKYRMFDELTFAKDCMLDDLRDGFVVENAYHHIEYHNAMAEELFPKIANSTSEKEVLDRLSTLAKTGEMIFAKDRVYFVSEEAVENLGINYGRVFEIQDVSERYFYTARLRDEVYEKTEHIHSIQDKITKNFAALLEARDSVTGEHIAQATAYVDTLCQELVRRQSFPDSLTEDYVRVLKQVAPLHDIGKIAISDIILNKPGRLTKDEFEIMKTHAAKGADMVVQTFSGLESEQYVSMAQNVAKYHHERWDGTGYPEGLAGMKIPLSAQIVSICDVYDALRSARPYKDAFPKEKAMAIIAEERGKQFNPIITDIFLDIAKDF